jgi:malonyl-CoA O-methyltransferase
VPDAKTDGRIELDKRGIRMAFTRAAATYDGAAVLQREIADRMLERLDLLKSAPKNVVDAGCGTGYCARALARRFRRARVIGVDSSPAMLHQARRRVGWFSKTRYVGGDVEHLPISDSAVDMVVSNLTLQWCDLQRAVSEFLRVLRPGGVLLFTSFGPDTLKELRQAWRSADSFPHVHMFVDMHDVGDALVRAGFADPVMEMEHITLTYAGVKDVMRDLKCLGAHNVALTRARGLTGKTGFARFETAYRQFASGGRVPATYEIVYGHAWAAQNPRIQDGVTAVPLSRFLRRPR